MLRPEGDGMDYQKRHHPRNQIASAMLLRRLMKQHPEYGPPSGEFKLSNDEDAEIFDIKCAVAKYFGRSLDEMDNPDGRTTEEIAPRWVFMFLARHAGKKFTKIGKSLGLHHASVMHGFQKFMDLARDDWTIAYDAAYVDKILLGESAQRPAKCLAAPDDRTDDKSQIINNVCAKFQITRDHFHGSTRNGIVTVARREAIVALKCTGLSRMAIARAMGLNPSTVIYWLNEAKRESVKAKMLANARSKAKAKRNGHIHNAAQNPSPSKAAPDRVSPVAHSPGAAALHSPR
jgi:hypothetical protein